MFVDIIIKLFGQVLLVNAIQVGEQKFSLVERKITVRTTHGCILVVNLSQVGLQVRLVCITLRAKITVEVSGPVVDNPRVTLEMSMLSKSGRTFGAFVRF